uniref:Adenylate kinase active site lid domain-containing protein n=2 Tax=Chrysotila carterae TaxID=13221 RepID=A0A7S4B918_CHRCT
MERGELVPDEVIIGIVKDRLAESDCKENGWLLDGFPRTEEQAKALAAAGIEPTKVLYLQVPDEMLIERVVGRRLDPETGKIYHLKFAPPESDEVAARLTQRSDDTEEKARVRLQAFHKHMSAVESCYIGIISYVDGTKPKTEVFAELQKSLE